MRSRREANSANTPPFFAAYARIAHSVLRCALRPPEVKSTVTGSPDALSNPAKNVPPDAKAKLSIRRDLCGVSAHWPPTDPNGLSTPDPSITLIMSGPSNFATLPPTFVRTISGLMFTERSKLPPPEDDRLIAITPSDGRTRPSVFGKLGNTPFKLIIVWKSASPSRSSPLRIKPVVKFTSLSASIGIPS